MLSLEVQRSTVSECSLTRRKGESICAERYFTLMAEWVDRCAVAQQLRRTAGRTSAARPAPRSDRWMAARDAPLSAVASPPPPHPQWEVAGPPGRGHPPRYPLPGSSAAIGTAV